MQSTSEERKLVVFHLGEEEMGVEVSQVREIIRVSHITPLPRSPAFIKGVANIRGQVITIIDLAERLSLPSHDGEGRIMVMELKGHTVGVMVDAVSEVLQLPLADIQPPTLLSGSGIELDYLTGIANMDGRLIILVDLEKILLGKEQEKPEVKGTETKAKDFYDQKEPKPVKKETRAIRTLIADDAAFMRMMLKDTLPSTEFEIVGEAEDGIQAAKKYQELRPDLVIMDIIMPEMDGIEATRSIVKADPGAKILIVSAMGQEGLTKEAIQAGAKDFIVKPFEAQKVLEVVEAIVGGSHEQS
jgi:two-component system chemotaxis response regulator CheY